ncbi:hypothetical protein HDE_02842 [Halotydeus destructor]|nr:hypothetical protein HDE_02842 [Halotydeus destructor]
MVRDGSSTNFDAIVLCRKPNLPKVPQLLSHCPKTTVTDHPLKPFAVTKKLSIISPAEEQSKADKPKKASTSWGGLDPLSAALSEVQIESPLAFQSKPSKVSGGIPKDARLEESDFKWRLAKLDILSKYTTTEKLSLRSSYLTGQNLSSSIVRNLQPVSMSEKVKNRLEQLDDFEEGSVREVKNLSQQEFVKHIEELSQSLKTSWDQDQRVKALKIAIQCSKMLSDVSVIHFYPSKFVLVTDLLDNFGKMVYERIHLKAQGPQGDSGLETCKNWLYKIASIRELLPRLYVETAVMKINSFLGNEPEKSMIDNLMRLSKMIRGISNPVVAAFARAYICRVCTQTISYDTTVTQFNFKDFFTVRSQFKSFLVENLLVTQKVSNSDLYTILVPALDWQLSCLCSSSSDAVMNEILEYFRSNVDPTLDAGLYALVLNSMLTKFRPPFIALKLKLYFDMIKLSHVNGGMFPVSLLLQNLGIALSYSQDECKSLDDGFKLIFLNDLWKIVAKLQLTEYIKCANIWIQFVVRHLSPNEVNILSKDIVKHVLKEKNSEENYPQLISIISKIASMNLEDFSTFLAMDNFLPLIDLLQKESAKVEACKIVVKEYLALIKDSDEITKVSDAVVINSLSQLCKSMHDSLNSLSLDDDVRQVSELINELLNLVVFSDGEAHLNFFVEARASYSNLDNVIAMIVQLVNRLEMCSNDSEKKSSRKKGSFVRACVAFNFITIPSLEDHVQRLQLYLLSAEVALSHGCLAQTDALLRTTIVLISQLPSHQKSSEGKANSLDTFFTSYVSNLLSFMLLVPDHPDQEPLYLYRGLYNSVIERKFENPDLRALLLLKFLAFLSAASQPSYPYHIANIDSNDTLYGGSETFLSVLKAFANQTLEHIIAHLTQLGEQQSYKRQSALVVECVAHILAYGDVQSMGKFTLKLWQLAHRSGNLETKTLNQMVQFTNSKGTV